MVTKWTVKLTKLQPADLLIRVARTFVAATAGALAVGAGNIHNVSSGEAVVIGALAAGVTAVLHLIPGVAKG